MLLEPSTVTVVPLGTTFGGEKDGVGVCAKAGFSTTSPINGSKAVSSARSNARLKLGVLFLGDVRCGISSKSFWNTSNKKALMKSSLRLKAA
jgi:hypothetical protein